MGFLLLESKKERLELIKILLDFYFKKKISIDEIHYLLDIIISDTRNLEIDLLDPQFLEIIGEFNQDYINHYNNLNPEDIDVDPSNYVLKDEFDFALRKLYKDLERI